MEKGINTNCSIYTLINKQRVRPDRTARLYIRITIKGKGSKKIALPLYWSVDHFDEEKAAITARSKADEDFLSYTAIIETEKAKYWRAVKRLLLKDVSFSIGDILAQVKLGDNGKYVTTWMYYKIRERIREKEIKPESGKNHKGSAAWVLKYRPEDVEIADVDSKWLNKYMVFLMKFMSYSGAWNRIKDLKAYIVLAREGGMNINDDFENHYLADPESDPVYLVKEEMDLLFNLYKDPNISSDNKTCVRAFLFNCFTGLRISDMKRFQTSWIENEEIVFSPSKRRLTDKKEFIVRIPLIPIAKEFLNTLSGEAFMERSAVKYNKRLKIIADLAGISKNLTSHVARHSFATQLAVLGVPVIVISKLLGHKRIESTMVYIHIAANIRQKEMDKLQNAFSSYTLSATA